jgi:Antitoxin ParD
MRLSIEVTPEQHQKLKAIAALSGQSIKDYVLERILPDLSAAEETEALRQLEAFLESRVKAAQDAATGKSVEEIFKETHQEKQ